MMTCDLCGRQCEAIQDPYCSWNLTSNRCVAADTNVAHVNSSACRSQPLPGIHARQPGMSALVVGMVGRV